jgi:transcriptional regulator with XRE-family HTH domain
VLGCVIHYRGVNPPPSKPLSYWLTVIGRYVRAKRVLLGKSQDEFSLARATISDIEHGRKNFTMETLVLLINELNGDLCEVFESPIPPTFRQNPDREAHERLARLLAGEPTQANFLRSYLEFLESRSHRPITARGTQRNS